jgi:hypothetical protein
MENLMFSANFNTSAEDRLRLSNKDACTYTFQKLDACSKIRHLEITGVSPFSGETAYNSALSRGVGFAKQFSNRQLA